jgi:hypothetical protein
MEMCAIKVFNQSKKSIAVIDATDCAKGSGTLHIPTFIKRVSIKKVLQVRKPWKAHVDPQI